MKASIHNTVPFFSTKSTGNIGTQFYDVTYFPYDRFQENAHVKAQKDTDAR
jgi:hypothetical protein